ncbi:MAG: sigma-70 family RNA polymerase sigma factor [Bacteroidetes bacterium]|nr:sigma-70 family RNA polymerase sigma factor [Bacteroidota bacterium]
MNIESDLITACIRRERKAEYELYRLTYSYLMGICYRYVNSREEAREMLNIGFTKMLYNLEKYRPEIPFKSWARKVMINVLIDEYRKEKKHHENIQYVEEYDETKEYSELNDALVKINVDQIHALIMKLPRMSQRVFNLFVIDGYSHKEIAGMLDMSEGTSKWHLNFSRTKLKEMIQQLISPLKVA